MRRAQKKQAEDFLQVLGQAHDEIKKSMECGDLPMALELLGQCQQGAIQLGTLIETTEGEGFVTVVILEEYCELVYQIFEQVSREQEVDILSRYQQLCQLFNRIVDSVRLDIKVRLEAVFLPYKASMWDSLESVWQAADADPDCDAYVIPIPYYDKNSDGSFGQRHYEIRQYPKYVPVVRYEDYDFEKRRPDMIFIHNPYDEYNYVTSVNPFFYSHNLKQFTDLLVYIPYYSTSGGMSEGQAQCLSYYNVDYIVIQAEKYRQFFDAGLPQEKLLPFGSPKFDRVIRICKHPPQPPKEWKERMEGKKVYFYNTSIGGLLGNTEKFLKKIEYVFQCFKDREDACLLWRPHPLLESTLDSMRPWYREEFDRIRNAFLDEKWGIYDTTPDITNTIALCDAYIGDGMTSVTSLFGVVGKPIFLLNGNIDAKPEKEDWRGSIISGFSVYGDNRWMITQGDKLYYSSSENHLQYRYCCDLSEYADEGCYLQVICVDGKNYACPINETAILLVSEKGIERRIQLDACKEQRGAFCGAISYKSYLFLIPNLYPAVVRYDVKKDEIRYINKKIDIFSDKVTNKKQIGGYCIQGEYLFIASSIDNCVLGIHIETGEEQVIDMNGNHSCGCVALIPDGQNIWFLPYHGTVITRWNPYTGERREYQDYPAGFQCTNRIMDRECTEQPFGQAVIYQDFIYFSPNWANMFIKLNKKTGVMTEWKPRIHLPEKEKNGYYSTLSGGYFLQPSGSYQGAGYYYFSTLDRRFYDLNLETGEGREIHIEFDMEDVVANENGFRENSAHLQYACEENAFNTLTDFLDNSITGNAFDRDRQLSAFRRIVANTDSGCGDKVYRFMCEKLYKDEE